MIILFLKMKEDIVKFFNFTFYKNIRLLKEEELKKKEQKEKNIRKNKLKLKEKIMKILN